MLEPFSQPFFVMIFFSSYGVSNYLPWLASNNNPDLCLLSSCDYRHEPLAPGKQL
jgi:hypothetical protein